ncbi:hypothetical protein ACEWY4_016528 [Coilia grayii]|uniref:Uncharacterized protein n=1 Tax=Coilia grayii TaxID=363190 RepID=A0ABD1JM12_9TELE
MSLKTSPEYALDNKPPDPSFNGVIMPVCWAEKQKFKSVQFSERTTPIPEWEESWKVTKNVFALEAKVDKELKEEECELDGLVRRLKPKDKSKILKERINGLFACSFHQQWNEAWKLPRAQPKEDHWAENGNTAIQNGPMILQPHLKKICLADWKESWKCSVFQTSFGRPSATEWKDSSLLGDELRTGREDWIRKVGIEKYWNQSDNCDIFCVPKRNMRAEMLDLMGTKEKYTFSPQWKQSYKSARSKQIANTEIGETPESELAKAWTQLKKGSLNQDSSLLNGGWSFTENIRQDRWLREHELLNEGFRHDSPNGFREWSGSWDSTRGQYRAVCATGAQTLAQLPQQQLQKYSSAAGWEDSWRFSSRKTLHDRPSKIEWLNTLEVSGGNGYKQKETWPEESMEIMPRKALNCEPRVGQFNASSHTDVFQNRVSPTEWMDSWRVATLQEHHTRFPFKSKIHLFAHILEEEEVPPWARTWKFINLLSRQDKSLWDVGWESFDVEIWRPFTDDDPLSDTAQSEWSMSWRICGPPPLECHDNGQRCSCHKSELISHKSCGRSCRFMAFNATSMQLDSFVITQKTDKTKCHLYSEIEKTSPFAAKWAKSAKLAKTQKWTMGGSTTTAQGKEEAENKSFKWNDAGTLADGSVCTQMAEGPCSEWVNSWRFHLASYSPSQEVKMSDRTEVTIALDNKQLRDQWESRANELKEKDNLERSRVQKSALSGLFQEWNYRLALRSGVPAGEKKGKDMSDFRKYVVTAPKAEQDEEALKAKFKVVSPPKRQAPPPPPPPPPQKKREPKPAPPPAPRKEREPKPEEKKPTRAPQPARTPSAPQQAKAPSAPQPMAAAAARPTVYKDNLSEATWNESWKILKPLIDMESVLGTGNEAFELNVHKYRSVQHSLDKTWPASTEWNKSCPTLKNEVHKDYPVRQKPWRSFQQPESFSSSDWAESWKVQNPGFQQQVEAWGQEWSGYCRQPKDKSGDAQLRGDVPQGWEESWKFTKTQPKQESEHLESDDYWNKELRDLYKHGMFCPGWNESWKALEMQTELWKVTEMANNHKAFEDVYLKDWAESWRCCRQHNWCKESTHQHFRRYVFLMSKRMMLNKLKSFQLQGDVPPEWTESWKLVKGQTQPKEMEVSPAEVDVSHVPLHLQFHMLNTKFPCWDKSWSVSKAPCGGEEAQPAPQWRNSWKISNPNPSAGSDTKQDVVCWSNEHKTSRYMESNTDNMNQQVTPSEWSGSWQTVKPPAKSETGPQQEPTEGQDSASNHLHLLEIPLLDWNDSWRFTNRHASSYTVSLSRWSESWKFSNPNDGSALQDKEMHRQKSNGRTHQEGALAVEPQNFTEWGNSWKYLTPDSLKPDMPHAQDSGEWGESWRVLNPQLYLKKEEWSKQEYGGDLQYICLQLSFLSKEDKKLLSPELSQSEWNDSWKLFKQEADHKRE